MFKLMGKSKYTTADYKDLFIWTHCSIIISLLLNVMVCLNKNEGFTVDVHSIP